MFPGQRAPRSSGVYGKRTPWKRPPLPAEKLHRATYSGVERRRRCARTGLRDYGRSRGVARRPDVADGGDDTGRRCPSARAFSLDEARARIKDVTGPGSSEATEYDHSSWALRVMPPGVMKRLEESRTQPIAKFRVTWPEPDKWPCSLLPLPPPRSVERARVCSVVKSRRERGQIRLSGGEEAVGAKGRGAGARRYRGNPARTGAPSCKPPAVRCARFRHCTSVVTKGWCQCGHSAPAPWLGCANATPASSSYREWSSRRRRRRQYQRPTTVMVSRGRHTGDCWLCWLTIKTRHLGLANGAVAALVGRSWGRTAFGNNAR